MEQKEKEKEKTKEILKEMCLQISNHLPEAYSNHSTISYYILDINDDTLILSLMLNLYTRMLFF